ncbi:roadblock/LC7 domain-containing protein [Oceanithermus sp.]
MSKQEQLQGILKEIKQALPELRSVVVASADGLPIVHDSADAPRVAAMAATALGLGKRISQTTDLGPLQETIVRGNDGYFVVYAAGDKGVLALAAPADANLGLIHLEARDFAARLAQLL